MSVNKIRRSAISIILAMSVIACLFVAQVPLTAMADPDENVYYGFEDSSIVTPAGGTNLDSSNKTEGNNSASYIRGNDTWLTGADVAFRGVEYYLNNLNFNLNRVLNGEGRVAIDVYISDNSSLVDAGFGYFRMVFSNVAGFDWTQFGMWSNLHTGLIAGKWNTVYLDLASMSDYGINTANPIQSVYIQFAAAKTADPSFTLKLDNLRFVENPPEEVLYYGFDDTPIASGSGSCIDTDTKTEGSGSLAYTWENDTNFEQWARGIQWAADTNFNVSGVLNGEGRIAIDVFVSDLNGMRNEYPNDLRVSFSNSPMTASSGKGEDYPWNPCAIFNLQISELKVGQWTTFYLDIASDTNADRTMDWSQNIKSIYVWFVANQIATKEFTVKFDNLRMIKNRSDEIIYCGFEPGTQINNLQTERGLSLDTVNKIQGESSLSYNVENDIYYSSPAAFAYYTNTAFSLSRILNGEGRLAIDVYVSDASALVELGVGYFRMFFSNNPSPGADFCWTAHSGIGNLHAGLKSGEWTTVYIDLDSLSGSMDTSKLIQSVFLQAAVDTDATDFTIKFDNLRMVKNAVGDVYYGFEDTPVTASSGFSLDETAKTEGNKSLSYIWGDDANFGAGASGVAWQANTNFNLSRVLNGEGRLAVDIYISDLSGLRMQNADEFRISFSNSALAAGAYPWNPCAIWNGLNTGLEAGKWNTVYLDLGNDVNKAIDWSQNVRSIFIQFVVNADTSADFTIKFDNLRFVNNASLGIFYSFEADTQYKAEHGFSMDTAQKSEGLRSLSYNQADDTVTTDDPRVPTWNGQFTYNLSKIKSGNGRLAIDIFVSDPTQIGAIPGINGIRAGVGNNVLDAGGNFDWSACAFWNNIPYQSLEANKWNTVILDVYTATPNGAFDWSLDMKSFFIQFVRDSGATDLVVKFDNLRTVPNAPAEDGLVYGFEPNSKPIWNYPNFTLATENQAQGAGCLVYSVADTSARPIAHWTATFDSVDATRAGKSGRFTIKLFTNDPARVAASGDLMLRIFLSSDKRDAAWDGTDNMIMWNMPVDHLQANIWNTVELDLSKATAFGSINYENINYVCVQAQTESSDQPFILKFDDFRAESTPPADPVLPSQIHPLDQTTGNLGNGYAIDSKGSEEFEPCLSYKANAPASEQMTTWGEEIHPVSLISHAGNCKLTMKVWVSDAARLKQSSYGFAMRVLLANNKRMPDGDDGVAAFNVDVSKLVSGAWNTVELDLSAPDAKGGVFDMSNINYVAIQTNISAGGEFELRYFNLEGKQKQAIPKIVGGDVGICYFDTPGTPGYVSGLSGFSTITSGQKEGSGALQFKGQGGAAAWYSKVDMFNLTQIEERGGYIEFDLWISDPERLKARTDGTPGLRIQLEGNNGSEYWLNCMWWDLTDEQLAALTANQWNTIRLPYNAPSGDTRLSTTPVPDQYASFGRRFSAQTMDFVGVILSATDGPDVTVRIDNMRARLDLSDKTLIEGFNAGMKYEVEYPEKLSIDTDNHTEGDGALKATFDSTQRMQFSLYTVMKSFDASAIAGGGKFTFKLYVNDPGRIMDVDGLTLRIILSSNGTFPTDWTNGTSNFVHWNLTAPNLKANEWNTVELPWDEAVWNGGVFIGGFNPGNLNFFQWQMGLAESSQPFTALIDEFRMVPNDYGGQGDGTYKTKDRSMGIDGSGKGGTAAGTGGGWNGADSNKGWYGIDPRALEIIQKSPWDENE